MTDNSKGIISLKKINKKYARKQVIFGEFSMLDRMTPAQRGAAIARGLEADRLPCNPNMANGVARIYGCKISQFNNDPKTLLLPPLSSGPPPAGDVALTRSKSELRTEPLLASNSAVPLFWGIVSAFGVVSYTLLSRNLIKKFGNILVSGFLEWCR